MKINRTWMRRGSLAAAAMLFTAVACKQSPPSAEQQVDRAQKAQEQARSAGEKANQEAQGAQERAAQAQQQIPQQAEDQQAQESAGTAAAREGKTTQRTRTPSQPGGPTSSADGTVQKASTDAVVIERKGAPDLSLKIDSQTQVMKNGQAATISDLQSGTNVSVQYRVDRDQSVAQRIDVNDSGQDAKPSATPPEATQPPQGGSSQP